jgi:DNA-binding NarL/FixJ family response regulator
MGSQQDVVRVALVDDDPDTRLLLRIACELDPRYELVGEFVTVADAVPGLLTRDVDVVLVDRVGAGSRSLERLAQLRVAVGRARIVVIDHAEEPAPADLVLAAGADAFLDPTAFTRVADALRLASGRLEVAA